MMLQKKYPDLSVVILAGGKGKRLQDRTNGIPKPMVQFGNKTIIDHQLDMCASFELNDINILGGHKAEILEKHIKKWNLGNQENQKIRKVIKLGNWENQELWKLGNL